ncbi:hypothetical protein L1987_38173 [Smallanthus sonchifolius]|uniref:Uncharacterized protein n=1 Tax=Smallanthus sonchifolius TaxID=185202 RepID=A0ACB9HHX2_9ASTR|nr:hypothetical protein L1987_38173 [Smallanthus sonchifolius]
MTNGPSVISESLAQYGDLVYVDRKQCSSQAVSGSYADHAVHFMELPTDIPNRQVSAIDESRDMWKMYLELKNVLLLWQVVLILSRETREKLDQLDEEDRAIRYLCDFEQRFKFHKGFDEIDYIDNVRVYDEMPNIDDLMMKLWW